MLGLSHTTGYAIQALACMEGPGGHPVLVREIADRTGIAKPYLAKIVHALSRRGLIDTKRGYRGGVLLARPPHAITLLEITEAVEGAGAMHRCLLGSAECTDERACPSHAFWVPMRERILQRLRSISLRDVAAFERTSLMRRRRAADTDEGAENRPQGRTPRRVAPGRRRS